MINTLKHCQNNTKYKINVAILHVCSSYIKSVNLQKQGQSYCFCCTLKLVGFRPKDEYQKIRIVQCFCRPLKTFCCVVIIHKDWWSGFRSIHVSPSHDTEPELDQRDGMFWILSRSFLSPYFGFPSHC